MNEQQWIKSLDHNDDPIPEIDVAHTVMRDIRAREQAPAEPSFAWPALLATIAGGGAVALAFSSFLTFSDPLTSFLDSFKLVLQ